MATDTNNAVLEIIELTKVFRGFWGRERVKALDSLNLEVQQGEVFGLLGPNGSGKTTTVRIILGLLFPTRGAVRLFGKSPRNVTVKQRIGYMPEESHLYSYLNAEETLDFFGRLFGLSRADRRRRTDALIEMVGLNRARKRPIGEYSKGMARRIGLAQSLLNDPDLLILDEPTTGLDPIGAREMKDLILTLRDRGKTIFLCSHLLADVEEICDRICILYGGKARAMGSVSEMLTAEEMTQIRAPRLTEEVVMEVQALVRNAIGPAADVEVSAPTRRLEELFLDVVRAARRERLATAGAEAGTGTAEFLGQEETAERVLEELVAAARQEEQEAPEPEAPPAVAPHMGGDTELIDELVGQPGAQAEGEPEEPTEQAARESIPVDEQMLRELIDDSEDSDEGPEGDDRDDT
ncbi:MAG: ABC transporter ATP-binding protein [Candidatus Brocadiia bacterium]